MSPGIPYDQDARDTEDQRMASDDRRIARLASAEMASYVGVEEYEMWVIVQRLRALTRSGSTTDMIKARLQPLR